MNRQGYNVKSYQIKEQLSWKALRETIDEPKILLIHNELNNLGSNQLSFRSPPPI